MNANFLYLDWIDEQKSGFDHAIVRTTIFCLHC